MQKSCSRERLTKDGPKSSQLQDILNKYFDKPQKFQYGSFSPLKLHKNGTKKPPGCDRKAMLAHKAFISYECHL
jgi:hypothetical protein